VVGTKPVIRAQKGRAIESCAPFSIFPESVAVGAAREMRWSSTFVSLRPSSSERFSLLISQTS